MTKNPFDVTKAVDFTDQEIAANWVDLPGGGFYSLADPTSVMPRFLVGGKGGGRTHLLRYFSYALQRIRHGADLASGIKRDGYIGIYFRCGGLNSSRFSGKGQDSDTWAAVFSFYTEVWLGRLTLELLSGFYSEAQLDRASPEIRSFAGAVAALFGRPLEVAADTADPLASLTEAFRSLQRDLDMAINNAAMSRKLDAEVLANPGALVFGVPQAATGYLSAFSGVVFAFLLDEFENLTAQQQRYVNTLIREKQLPTTFLVGSRRYGLRTHATLSAGEENRQGSEYDLVVLEDAYRAQGGRYSKFCAEIVRRRLAEAGLDIGPRSGLEALFEHPKDRAASLEDRARLHVQQELSVGEQRPWLTRLSDQLASSQWAKQVTDIVAAVTVADSPLHEKFAVLLLYRCWANGADMAAAASQVRLDVEHLLSTRQDNRKISISYRHYKQDLFAQLLASLRLPQEYYGIEDFVRMSAYLPRNLLVLLKQITRWSEFLGERPFRGTKISLEAQREGVREACMWFLGDAKGLGPVGEETQFAIRRLASLFKDMRFSDKPVEVSCSAFATDRRGMAASAVACLDEAISHSLLLEVPAGRSHKNSGVLHRKYQLNPMLAPLFDLPLALRGVVDLSSEELNVIFDPGASEASFTAVKRRQLSRMIAPFKDAAPQPSLWEA